MHMFRRERLTKIEISLNYLAKIVIFNSKLANICIIYFFFNHTDCILNTDEEAFFKKKYKYWPMFFVSDNWFLTRTTMPNKNNYRKSIKSHFFILDSV